MGYIKHHAIVVTSWNDHALERARKAAVEAGCTVTPITDAGVNGYRSFLVAPDGSKEGWDASAEGDAAREAFKDFMLGDDYLEWAEVAYGSDDAAVSVTDHAWVRNPVED